MIGKLLKMHSISHIISVDDCYSDSDDKEIKPLLFSEMSESLDGFEVIVQKIGKGQEFEEIKELIELGGDKNLLINNFLNDLSTENIMELYKQFISLSGKNFDREKDRLLVFLHTLVKEGYIEDFDVFASTQEALNCEYVKKAKKTEGILWLIDRNFESVGESSEAGMEFAKTIVERKNGPVNYVFILSSMREDADEDDDTIEKEFDEVLLSKYNFREPSFVFYLYKQRIIPEKLDRFAKSLAQGFKRKACYELIDLYVSALRTSIDSSSKVLFDIRQDTMNYLFDEMVSENDESYLEFMNRFVGIFQTDEYQKALANDFQIIAQKMQYYKKLSNTVVVKSQKEQTEKVKAFRKVELYNYHINKQHFEISTGDIFKINGQFYFLATQPCDTCLRSGGKRILKNATLLLICENKQLFVHKLSCFENYTLPVVDFRSQLVYPFEILDLCVLNTDGKAILPLEGIDEQKQSLEWYTDRYCTRVYHVVETIKKVVKNDILLNNYWTNNDEALFLEAKKAYEDNKNIQPELLQYSYDRGEISYDAQRICRLDEIISIDIMNKFGMNLSRVGHAFDFTDKSSRNNKVNN